eukprot:scaffold195571_cov31-Tisochrysis_lutea.AAC.5
MHRWSLADDRRPPVRLPLMRQGRAKQYEQLASPSSECSCRDDAFSSALLACAALDSRPGCRSNLEGSEAE